MVISVFRYFARISLFLKMFDNLLGGGFAPIALFCNCIKQPRRVAKYPPIPVALVDKELHIIVLVVHCRQRLEQLNVIAAVDGRVFVACIFGFELVDAVFGSLIIVANPVHLVSDFKPINPATMKGIPAVEQATGAYIIPDSFQPFSQFLALLHILDANKARCFKFHTISPTQIRKPRPTDFTISISFRAFLAFYYYIPF